MDRIEEYIKSHPEAGYKSLADFVTEAARKRCEELKILVPRPEPPVLEHFNVNQDQVTVIDHKRRMFADVYFRNDHVYCELCEEEDCEHIKYALGLSKVQKALERKGWITEREDKSYENQIKSAPNIYMCEENGGKEIRSELLSCTSQSSRKHQHSKKQ